MTNPMNVVVIAERLITYLRQTRDEYIRSDLVARITQLAERFAPDNQWFLQTMNAVFELGNQIIVKFIHVDNYSLSLTPSSPPPFILKLTSHSLSPPLSLPSPPGGSLVRREVAHNLMRLIAEGTDDDDTDAELRLDAVSSYVELLDKSNLPDILVKIICWVSATYMYMYLRVAGWSFDDPYLFVNSLLVHQFCINHCIPVKLSTPYPLLIY
jgi:AP-4 complex subunit epsilon-1